MRFFQFSKTRSNVDLLFLVNKQEAESNSESVLSYCSKIEMECLHFDIRKRDPFNYDEETNELLRT